MKYFNDETFEQSATPLVTGEYEDCTFHYLDLSNSNLSNCLFIGCEFLGCNLSNINLTNSSLQDSSFSQCKMLGLRFDTCNAFGFSVTFETCQLSHAVFTAMNLKNCRFENCELLHVDFTESVLSDVVMRKCSLDGATFDRTRLENTDLRNSTGFRIDPENNFIKGARFSREEAIHLLDKYRLKIE